MSQQENVRSCQYCERTIKGRSDKKFCDDNCRNNYNNRTKSEKNNTIRNITNALLKNRRILESALPEGYQTIRKTKNELLTLGFSFKYHTHTFTNQQGTQYHYCYDHGYLILDGERIIILKDRAKG